MKKIVFLFSFIALTIAGLSIYSCQKKTLEDTSLTGQLNALEKEVKYSLMEDSKSDSNLIYSDLEKNKSVFADFATEMQKAKINANKGFFEKQAKNKSHLTDIETKYSKNASLFIEKLNKIRNEIPVERQYELFLKYDNFIDTFFVGTPDYENLKKTIALLKWMNYEYVLKYNDLSIVSRNMTMGYETRWQPCGHRDCFDCCMYRKLKEDRNIVEYAAVLITFPQSLAWFSASCLYDCTRIHYGI